MKTIDLLSNSSVTLYNRVFDKTGKTITLFHWLQICQTKLKPQCDLIRSTNQTDPKKAKELKEKTLPAATISASFENSRKAEQATHLNEVICVDIDELPEGDDVETIKSKILAFPFVFYVAKSARGEGVFALCHVKFTNANEFGRVFEGLRLFFLSKGVKIDTACSDITRLRFGSYDEHYLWKKEVEPFEPANTPAMTYNGVGNYDYSTYGSQSNQKYFLSDFELKHFNYIWDAAMDLINTEVWKVPSYDDFMQAAYRLARLSTKDRMHDQFIKLCKSSPNYDEKAAELKWQYAVRDTRAFRNRFSLSWFLAAAYKNWGPRWFQMHFEENAGEYDDEGQLSYPDPTPIVNRMESREAQEFFDYERAYLDRIFEPEPQPETENSKLKK